MSKSILISRPGHDEETMYLKAWSEEIKSMAIQKGMAVYDLEGEKATRKNLESYVAKHNPLFVFINGHGNKEAIGGHENEIILDLNSDLAVGVIYARSCESGKDLGSDLVKKSVKSFIGYTRKFIFGYLPDKATRPLTDPFAKLFLDPSNLVASTILKGHTVKDADQRSKEAMYRNFRKMISSNASFEEKYAARWLWSNLNSQVLLGDINYRV